MKPFERGLLGADSVGCRFVRRAISPPQVGGTHTTAQILPNAVRQNRENLIAGVVGW